jgi:ribose 5-phosphate isomerase A
MGRALLLKIGEREMSQREELKRRAAEQAVALVQPGMVVGLGVGSTAMFAVQRIAELLAAGALHGIVGIPCAERVAHEARRLGIPLATLDEQFIVDAQLNLIKGGGGALLREKMVAQASRREVIVVDAAKCVPVLGGFPLPVEVVPFGWGANARFVAALGAAVELRRDEMGTPYRTDQGNFILDCAFGQLGDPAALAAALERRAGIVEHGLFLGLATDLFVADDDGVRHVEGTWPRPSGTKQTLPPL